MGVAPQRACNFHRVNPGTFPPSRFIAAAVELTVVTSAQWNGDASAETEIEGVSASE